MYIPHPNHPQKQFFFDNLLYENIVLLRKRVQMDKDALIIIVGSPGEGKSTLAQQVLYVLNSNTDVGVIQWEAIEYMKYCDVLFKANASKGKGAIYDESRESLTSVSVMSKKTKSFMNYLYENRQCNMYQILLSGNFFDFPKSIIMNRATCMLQVKEGEEFENGIFKFYNRRDMRILYMRGKKDNSMDAWKSNDIFTGKFEGFYCVDEAAYRKIKRDTLDIKRFVDEPKLKKEVTLAAICKYLMQRNPIGNFSFLKDFGIHKSTISRTLQEVRKEMGVAVDSDYTNNITTTANQEFKSGLLKLNNKGELNE